MFPGIDSRIKFCLLTLSGTELLIEQAEFAFFLYQAEQLRDPERRFALSAADFSLFNPNTRTCPIFRTRREMEIARKLYRRAGVLWMEARGNQVEINPWGVKFSRMFDMSNDSRYFRTRKELEEEGWELHGNVFSRDGEHYLPLYEAKMFHQYDHRFATFEGVSTGEIRKGNAKSVTSNEKANTRYVALPRYWVPEDEVFRRLDKREKTVQETIQLRPDQTRPDQTRPDQTRPDQTRPDQTRPDQTRPDQTRPDQTRPDQTRPDQTRPDHRPPRRTGSQLALRKITNATNERTGIYAMIPIVGFSDSGTTIIVGSLSLEISHAQPTIEPQSS